MNEQAKTVPTLDELRAQRDAIIEMAEKHGVYNVRVFGSVARGEATPESDVDILVSAKSGVSVFDLVGLWLDLQDLLEREVSLVTDEVTPRREQFLRRALKDAAPL